MCKLPMNPEIREGKDALRRHFVNTRNEPVKTPYYQHQLQILYEGRFFWWIIKDALEELVNEGYLTVFDKERVPDLADLRHVPTLKFYANADAVKTSRDEASMKTRVLATAKMLNTYSSDKNNKVLGKQLESLVENQLKILQFDVLDRHTNAHEGKKWSRTNHNLDFIARRGSLVIGVEVKNSLNIISAEEIDIKIDICRHLGIVPVFAVRWIKPYTECIRKQGGFSWVFKTQILPFGYEQMAKDMFTRLSVRGKKNDRGYQLKFPITTRNDLPPKSVKLFELWAKKAEAHPPVQESGVRCVRKKEQT